MLTKTQKDILIGSLLGDGSLYMHPHGIHPSFIITRSTSDLQYLKHEFGVFENLCSTGIKNKIIYDKRTKRHYNRSYFCTKNVKEFDQYYKDWYAGGPKTVPRSLKLSPLSMAIWFCDDGTIIYTTPSKRSIQITLSTDSFIKNDVEFLAKTLSDRYGDNFRVTRHGTHFVIRVSTFGSTQLIKEIDQYIPSGVCTRKTKLWKNKINKFINTKSHIYMHNIRMNAYKTCFKNQTVITTGQIVKLLSKNKNIVRYYRIEEIRPRMTRDFRTLIKNGTIEIIGRSSRYRSYKLIGEIHGQ